MIIKIIPEDGENIQEITHYNVKEFFMFGNRIAEDQKLKDFHEWNGGYKYLIGSLYFFLNKVMEKYNGQEVRNAGPVPNLPTPPPERPQLELMPEANTVDNPEGGMLKKVTQSNPDLQVVAVEESDPEDASPLVEESEGAEDESAGAEDD